jgi:hypothetical protein
MTWRCVPAWRTRRCKRPMPPTLLNSCAKAATAAEARFRIDRPIAGRSVRVVALDDGAAAVVRRAAEEPWRGARFLTCEGRAPALSATNGASVDIVLHALDGPDCQLSEELADADIMVVIATSDDGADVARSIAQACARRGVMTAGLILGPEREVGGAVSALRPYAPVLLVSDDEGDLAEVLMALRA